MKKKRQVLSFILIFILLGVNCCPVYAFSEDNIARQHLESIWRGVLSSDGTQYEDSVFEEMFDAWFPSTGSNFSLTDLDALYEEIVGGTSVISSGILFGSDGYIVSESAVKQIKEVDAKYREETLPDMVWAPVVASDDVSVTHFYSTTQYQQFRSVVDDMDLAFISTAYCWNNLAGVSEYSWFCLDLSDCYILNMNSWNASFVNFVNYLTSVFGVEHTTSSQFFYGSVYNSSGVEKSISNSTLRYSDYGLVRGDYNSNLERVFLDYECITYKTSNPSFGFLVRGCNGDTSHAFIPIFSSANALKKYLVGEADYYRFEPVYTGGDIVIDPDVDYGQIYDAVKDAMLEASGNGESMAAQLAAAQSAYFATMEKIGQGLADIEDSIEDSNDILQKIYDRLDQGFLESNDHFSQLEEIDRTILDRFTNVLSDLSTVLKLQNELLQTHLSGISDKLDDVTELDNKLYEAVTQGFEDIANGFSDILDVLNEITELLSTLSFESGDSGNSSGSEKKSIWTRLGELVSLLVTGILGLLAKIVYKILDGFMWLGNIILENIGLVFSEMSLVFTRLTGALVVGNGFYSTVYDHIPEVLRDLIAFVIFCIVAGGIISSIRDT